MKIRASLRMMMLALAAIAGAAGGVEAAQTGGSAPPDVFVPSFWDPSQLPEKPKPDGLTSIRFVTEDDYPPFGFMASDGTLVGFNVDLARAICEQLHVACTIQARRYDTIVPSLKAGASDAAIASMAITPQALVGVDFTSPYYKTPARFMARRDGQAGDIRPETIGQRHLGVERGTAHEAYLKAFFPEADLHSFTSATELRAALMSEGVDLAFGDGIAMAQWLQTPLGAQCCAFVGGPFTESRFFGEGAGIAVRKGNVALRTALDYALARLAARGVYTDLYLKYFPIDVY